MNRVIIGLVAPSQYGKTEVARHLMNRFGFTRVHLGLSVKRAVATGWGLTDRHVDGDLINEPCEQLGGIAPRLVLEFVGDATHRAAPQATAIAWEVAVRALPTVTSHVLADGIRRVSEAEAVRRLDGVVVRVDRPGYPIDMSLPCNLTQRDVRADITIVNDGSLEDLRIAAEMVYQRITGHSIDTAA